MRISVEITIRQQKKLIRRFGMYGAIEPFVKATGVSRGTLRRLLESKIATQGTIDKISDYIGEPIELVTENEPAQ